MSAAESENVTPREDGSPAAHGDKQLLTEYDGAPTEMTFDKGGVPLYVAIIWVVFLASYVAYMVVYGLPDFAAWSGR